MRFGIRTKFLIAISILLLIIFGGITVFQIRNSTRELRNDLFEESKAFASLATTPIGNVFAIYKDSGTFKIKQQMDEFTALNDSVINIAVVDIKGQAVFSQDASQKDMHITPNEASTFEPLYQTNDRGALSTIVYPYFEASGAHRYSIVYTVSDQEIEMAVDQEATQLFYVGMGSLLSTMALMYLLMNLLILRPIQQVSEQASVISAGNLEQQIRIKGRDEIASLGVSVNKMAESLKANIAQLQEVDKVKSEFMMITSHNLRTPLTIINGYLDNMNLVMNDTEKMISALSRIGASVKRLETFAEDVLTISRFELGDAEFQTDTVKLGEFMSRITTEFAPTADIRELHFDTDIQDPETEIKISMPYVRGALWNLLDNAVKFTKEGGDIRLSAKRVNQGVEIVVSDTGIGITPDELPKLFTKFHRGTSTLVYDYEGTGIGLYSSKVMIEKHGGTISVSSKEGEGSTFTIHLPLNPPPPSPPTVV